MIYETASQAKENSAQLDPSFILSSVTKCFQLLGNVNSHISGKRRAQVLRKIGQRYTSLPMSPGRIMAKSSLANSLNSASSIGQKQRKQFPLQVTCLEENSFFQGAPPQQDPSNEGVQQATTGMYSSETNLTGTQGHSGEGAEQH